ncbi:MAG TPA: DUF2950 family protein [Bryobacteraceae bacterium]|jgi:hypothetical protein|nr:DUF2950 family protein [Bryobacteraceae bacterium]
MFTSNYLQRCLRPGFGACTLLAVLIAGTSRPSFAKNARRPSFTSAEQAVEALDKAVKTNDQATISRFIGPLASSDDKIQDKADRQQFVHKYAEMHRLVKEPDGTIVLYIGAENWPFPVPLVSKNGRWSFDVDAGAKEITYRNIGGNETTAIETCRAIARAIGHEDSKSGDSAIDAYVQKFAGDAILPAETFSEYHFRILKTSNGAAVIAYPSEYGSTGVMTFAVSAAGPVYEKDLGPNTAAVAKSLASWTPSSGWQLVQLS